MKFMALIALNDSVIADSIPSTCSGTDSPGIEFIATAARMGTTLADIGGLDITTIDENTTISGGDVTAIVSGCEGDTACLDIIGESATSMYDTFCAEADLEENDICLDVFNAIQVGGTPDLIGQELINLLKD